MTIPVLIAGNALDGHSSWGKPKTNGLLQAPSGQFNGRGAAIKFGITGALLAGQFTMVRVTKRDPQLQNAVFNG